MNRRRLLVGTGTLATAALAGCLGDDGDNQNDGTGNNGENTAGNNNSDNNSDTGNSETRTITVSDSGEAEAEPDMAVFETSVEERGDSSGEVRDALSERSDQLYDALIAYGLDEDDVTTGRFDIGRQIDYRRFEKEHGRPPESESELEEYSYYEGTHSFNVEIEAVDEVGAIIDTAIDAGADDISRITYTLSDGKRDELREQALEEALSSAETEAEFLASEVDATIMEAKAIDSTGTSVSPVRESFDMDEDVAEDDTATELHPDDVTVSASVKVVYAIE